MSKPINVHGTGLVLGDVGVLLRGVSGAGKSVLALALLDRWELRGANALLLSDDRVDLVDHGSWLEMRAPANLAGMVELRGRGIVHRAYIESARLDLVVDLVPDLVRMVEEHELVTAMLDHELPRAPVPQAGVIGLGHQVLLVAEAIRASKRAAPA